MKTVFIVNPAAGHGRAARFWRGVEPLARRLFPDHRMRWTPGPRRAHELVRQELENGAEALVAVGGDGTLHETVDAFLSMPESLRARAAVGSLPAGSGCDFARHFGIPRDPRLWLPRLAGLRPRRIDAAKAVFEDFEGKRREAAFINIAAFGIAGTIAVDMLRSGKPLGGTASYLAASLKAIWTSKPRRMRLVIDGRLREGDFHLAALANTRSTGGGMRIAPAADAEDGLLDLILVGPLSRGRLLRQFPKIYSGTHLGVEGIEHLRLRALTAESDEPVFINIDGEAAGRLPASFEALPGALPVLLP